MKYRHIIITLLCIVSMLIATYIGYIYRPVAVPQAGLIEEKASYQFILRSDTININIYGSGYKNHHIQQREIQDLYYNRKRTGEINIYNTGGNTSIAIMKRIQNGKKGSSTHQVIDKIANQNINKAIKVLSSEDIILDISDNWPWTILHRSYEKLSINIHIYCHRKRRTRREYTCSLNARLSDPGGYRPINGYIETDTSSLKYNGDHDIDRSNPISIAELLHSVR